MHLAVSICPWEKERQKKGGEKKKKENEKERKEWRERKRERWREHDRYSSFIAVPCLF